MRSEWSNDIQLIDKKQLKEKAQARVRLLGLRRLTLVDDLCGCTQPPFYSS